MQHAQVECYTSLETDHISNNTTYQLRYTLQTRVSVILLFLSYLTKYMTY